MKSIKNRYKYNGLIDDAVRFIEKSQLLRKDLWDRFVRQFEEFSDNDGLWRSEYWGKMMRGACFVYAYSQDKDLYDILKQTVEDMMKTADEDGRISGYDREHEFNAWDLWGRKYVLLGMQYFIEVCDDEDFNKRIIDSMCAQLDYIISKIGDGEGKKSITSATRHWRGLNSSSILEPVVRLYSLTQKEEYLDFAKYIVDCGGTDVENIFELAYNNDFYPYQYPVTKAYEMASCFEGLLEYYYITGNERYKTAIINFADKILESDFTVIGCCGCTHELFDNSSVRQANTTNGEIMQETCVTVTLMKFLWRVHILTGDSKYADAFEISLYNAYLGSLNTEGVIEPTILKEYPDCKAEPLTFDSYSPLTSGTRGNGVGGFCVMNDAHYFGCCAAIGSMGIGLVPKMQLLKAENGFRMNLYIDGVLETETSNGKKIKFITETEYPKCGKVKITVKTEESVKFTLSLRNPEWSVNTKLFVCGEEFAYSNGYIAIERVWSDGDTVELLIDMTTKVIYPQSYGTRILMNKVIWGHNYMVSTFDKEDPFAKNHIALRRGPIMLAQEARLGYSPDEPVEVKILDGDIVETIEVAEKTAPYKNIIEVGVPLADGSVMHMTDYSSAGKLWTEESKMAVWVLTKDSHN